MPIEPPHGLRRPVRIDPPPGAELAAAMAPLSADQREAVLRHARLLRAGPVDQEALDREALRIYYDGPEAEPAENAVYRVAERFYRLGQAAGDARLRDAVAAFIDVWDLGACGENLRAGAEALRAAAEPMPIAPTFAPREREYLDLLAALPDDEREAIAAFLRTRRGGRCETGAASFAGVV